jgi:uncharacterized protein YcfJ
MSTNRRLGCIFIYLQIKHNSLYVFDNLGGGGNLSHKIIEYNCSKQMSSGRAKPIRIIGDPGNQLPDNWSSTLLVLILENEAELSLQ